MPQHTKWIRNLFSRLQRISGSSILMKPWFSIKRNKKRQTGNLCVSLETKKWFQHSSSVFKSNHFSVLPALPFLFLFMLNWQLLLHPQKGWQVEQQLSSCRHLAACSLLLVLRTSLRSGVHLSGELGKLAAQSQVFSAATAPVVQKKPKSIEGLRLSPIISKILICMSPSWIRQTVQRRTYCLWMGWQETRCVENPPQPQVSY